MENLLPHVMTPLISAIIGFIAAAITFSQKQSKSSGSNEAFIETIKNDITEIKNDIRRVYDRQEKDSRDIADLRGRVNTFLDMNLRGCSVMPASYYAGHTDIPETKKQ